MSRDRGKDTLSSFLTAANNQLSGLARTVSAECNGTSSALTAKWRDQIMHAADTSATLAYEEGIVGKAIEEELKRAGAQNSEGDEEEKGSSSSSDALVSAITANIADKMSSFDASKEKVPKAIRNVFGVGANDDDVNVMDAEETEESFKCPYSSTKIVDPTRNGQCIHVASRSSWLALLKTGAKDGKGKTRCFQSGCGAVFTKASLVADDEFADKMERFYRRLEKSSQFAKSNRIDEAEELDDDDVDAEVEAEVEVKVVQTRQEKQQVKQIKAERKSGSGRR